MNFVRSVMSIATSIWLINFGKLCKREIFDSLNVAHIFHPRKEFEKGWIFRNNKNFTATRFLKSSGNANGWALLMVLLLGVFSACGSSEIKPVDIYPEDMCNQCRMAISDQSFAAEIITKTEEVYKFDDIGCMEKFQAKAGELKVAALFVKEYETKNWLPFARSTIVPTGLKTPMGSGKAAFADSNKAREYLTKFSPNF